MYPTSSKEADLEANLICTLEEVPLDSMRKFVFFIQSFTCLPIHGFTDSLIVL
jgi:hypothetical protein